MAWIFPRIEMGFLKWATLILCFNLFRAEVTQQPQEWIKNHHFYENQLFLFSYAKFCRFANRKRRIEGQFLSISSVCLGDAVRLAL